MREESTSVRNARKAIAATVSAIFASGLSMTVESGPCIFA